MGERNYWIDGVSCAGKTTVGRELRRRDYEVVEGDDELAARPDTEWGGTADEGRAFARRQLVTGEGFPPGAVTIDAARSLDQVVGEILAAVFP